MASRLRIKEVNLVLDLFYRTVFRAVVSKLGCTLKSVVELCNNTYSRTSLLNFLIQYSWGVKQVSAF